MSAQIPDDNRDQRRILVAECGEYSFGVDIMSLVDVILRLDVTRVPLSLPHIMGLVNLRGQIVTEINVARSLQIQNSMTLENETSGYSLIINKAGQYYGFAFDAVGNVLTIGDSQITAVPETVSETWRNLSKGIYKDKDKLVVILDLHFLIDHLTELAARDNAA